MTTQKNGPSPVATGTALTDVVANHKFTRYTPALSTIKRARNGVWLITVEHCPHCGGKHHHGGGDGDEPALGHRVADCGARGGYYVVDGREHLEICDTRTMEVALRQIPGLRDWMIDEGWLQPPYLIPLAAGVAKSLLMAKLGRLK